MTEETIDIKPSKVSNILTYTEESIEPEPYTSCYCEENIYLLVKRRMNMQSAIQLQDEKSQNDIIINNHHFSYYAVIISSICKATPIWGQKSNVMTPEDPVLWDYHVIMVEKSPGGGALVYDFDSTMPFPCSAIDYISAAFRPEIQLRSSYEPYFRVISGSEYLNYFASNRSHMILENGLYSATPPYWPSIRGPLAASEHNLQNYISDDSPADGCPEIGMGSVYKSRDAFSTWILKP